MVSESGPSLSIYPISSLHPPSYSKQVLAGRLCQIQEKVELNRHAQEECVKYREQLIRELEEAKELTRREREEEEELKTARKQELESQVEPRSSSNLHPRSFRMLLANVLCLASFASF